MKTARRFDNRVENYVKYRPNYPSEIVAFFRNTLKLDKNSVIADIGSGTGISSRLFLENGNKVIGIEPNKLMRNASFEYLKDFPNFTALDAAADSTTLEDKSVDFVIAAQAFHWFAYAKTAKEFRRILRREGCIALIWNERKLDGNPFLREYEKFLLEFGTDYRAVRHDNFSGETLNDVFNTDFDLKTFENEQILDFEELRGRILSSSYMPSEDDPRFPALERNLKKLFAEHKRKGKIHILYDTNVFYTKL